VHWLSVGGGGICVYIVFGWNCMCERKRKIRYNGVEKVNASLWLSVSTTTVFVIQSHGIKYEGCFL